MARANFVKAAQKNIYENGKYVNYVSEKGKRKGQTLQKLDRTVPKNKEDKILIAKGESYYWWAFKNGGKHFSKTPPKASQLTQSNYLSQLYDIQDRINEVQVDSWEDLEGIVEEFKNELESLKDETQGSLDNMPGSLQSSPTGELLQERIDSLDNAISEFNSIDLQYEEPDESDIIEELKEEEEAEDENWTPSAEDIEARKQEKAQEWIDEKILEIQNICFD